MYRYLKKLDTGKFVEISADSTSFLSVFPKIIISIKCFIHPFPLTMRTKTLTFHLNF